MKKVLFTLLVALAAMVMAIPTYAATSPPDTEDGNSVDVAPPPPTKKLRLLSPKNNAKFGSYWDEDQYGDPLALGWVQFKVAGPKGLLDRWGDDHLYFEISTTAELDEDGAFVDSLGWGDEEYPYMDWFRPVFPKGRYMTRKHVFEAGVYYWHVFITHSCETFDEDECWMEFSPMRRFTIKKPRTPIPDWGSDNTTIY